jgi:hypothetical protein
MLASWLTSFDDTCADPALQAYESSANASRTASRFFIWLGVALASEQAVHAITLALGAQKLRFRVRVEPFQIPSGLTLAWVVFTALSIVLTALTWRSSAAVLAKTFHVLTEAIFLVFMLVEFGYRTAGGTAGSLVLIGVLMALSLPCRESITYAASSGLALDAVNFLVYAWYGLTRPKDAQLWLLIWGFGWHALYLVTMLGVMRWSSLQDSVKLAWRICGLYFNVIASECFLLAVRRELRVADGGVVRLDAWAASFSGDDLNGVPLCVWTSEGVRLLDPLSLSPRRSVCVDTHIPGRTAYAPGASAMMLRGIFPSLRNSSRFARTKDGVRVDAALLCGYGWTPPRNATGGALQLPDKAYVLSWNVVRAVYWLLALSVAAFISAFP